MLSTISRMHPHALRGAIHARASRISLFSRFNAALLLLLASIGFAIAALDSATATIPEKIDLTDGRTALFIGRNADAPLLIFIHAALGSGSGSLKSSGFAQATRFEGLNVAFGDSRDGIWRFDGLNGRTDHSDEDYIMELCEALRRRGYGSHGIFLVGVSNGGMLALQVACNHANSFDGVAVIATGMPTAVGDHCEHFPARAVVVVGEADPVIPISGGKGREPRIGAMWSLDRLTDLLLRRSGCERYEISSETENIAPSVLPLRAVGCEGGGKIELYRVVNGAHDTLFGFVSPSSIVRSLSRRAR